MNWYRHIGNIKAGLFLIGISLIVVLLMYSQGIVEKLRQDNREIVQLYAEIIAKTAADQSDANLDFVFEEIIKKVRFPIIYSSAEYEPIFYRNLPDTLMEPPELRKIQAVMGRTNQPIPIYYENPATSQKLMIGSLHYGDSRLIRQLQRLPYLQVGIVALFILFGFVGFNVIRNSEKRHIWVGMARETAHQLSTPVSALLGWVDWLKNHPAKADQVIPDMEVDLERLQQVTARFSKMGSDSDFTTIDLHAKIDTVVEYFRRRLPSLGKDVEILNKCDSGLMVKANGVLLPWAVENVIKNAIDAIDQDQGRIIISSRQNGNDLYLLIEDNGRGIPGKDWKNIFRPGFSSKDLGWGLGLSLTRRIISEIHHGSIAVEHSEPGKGTVIEIKLPV